MFKCKAINISWVDSPLNSHNDNFQDKTKIKAKQKLYRHKWWTFGFLPLFKWSALILAILLINKIWSCTNIRQLIVPVNKANLMTWQFYSKAVCWITALILLELTESSYWMVTTPPKSYSQPTSMYQLVSKHRVKQTNDQNIYLTQEKFQDQNVSERQVIIYEHLIWKRELS